MMKVLTITMVTATVPLTMEAVPTTMAVVGPAITDQILTTTMVVAILMVQTSTAMEVATTTGVPV